MSFSTITRRQAILKLLDKKSRLTVQELSDKFGVSGVTIRKDLDVLYGQGHLIKTYGGAIRSESGTDFITFEEKPKEACKQKESIARQAAALIEERQCLFMDASPTVAYVVPFLEEKRGLTILVNSVKLALDLAKRGRHNIFLLGGEFRKETMDTVGALNSATLERFGNITMLISPDGINPKTGVMSADVEQAGLIQSLLPATYQILLLAESSKFSNAGHYKLFDLQEVSALITDHKPPTDFLKRNPHPELKIIY